MAAPPQPLKTIIDDKSPHCIPFILSRLQIHRAQFPDVPFFIGLNGVQGAGKTTLVSALAQTLQQQEGLETLVCSIDDLYLKHKDQVALAAARPDNQLVQHRGEPGTHDMQLARELFTALRDSREIQIPSYDKSAFAGAGDRAPASQWHRANSASSTKKIQVIIFEGWCVGFRALPAAAVEAKYAACKDDPQSTLGKHKLEHLLFVNERLQDYDIMTDCFDAFIHIDALEPSYVYAWRLEQEAALRREKGSGMTDEQVVRFVDGYYPAYELFTEGVRGGVLRGDKAGEGKQLRLVVGRDRRVVEVAQI